MNVIAYADTANGCHVCPTCAEEMGKTEQFTPIFDIDCEAGEWMTCDTCGSWWHPYDGDWWPKGHKTPPEWDGGPSRIGPPENTWDVTLWDRTHDLVVLRYTSIHSPHCHVKYFAGDVQFGPGGGILLEWLDEETENFLWGLKD